MTKRIVVIDDDPEDVEILVDIIQSISSDYECITYNDPYDAVHSLGSIKPLPCLIIVDFNMPKIGGEKCIEEIRQIDGYATLPIVLNSTATPNKSVLNYIRNAGAIFLQKPSSYQELVKSLEEILRKCE